MSFLVADLPLAVAQTAAALLAGSLVARNAPPHSFLAIKQINLISK